MRRWPGSLRQAEVTEAAAVTIDRAFYHPDIPAVTMSVRVRSVTLSPTGGFRADKITEKKGRNALAIEGAAFVETTFTPLASFAGGMLIGTASVLLMAVHGRIAGATGIVKGFLFPADRQDWLWRLAFIAGMVSAPLLARLATGEMPRIDVPVSTLSLVIGGMLVGFGAALGSGCTSGHGVCGLARFSARSAVATVVFMAATGITVFIVRHVVGG